MGLSSLLPKPGAVCLGIICLWALCGTAQAQNRMGGRLNDPTRTNPIQQWQQRAVESEVIGLIALEGALDPEAYIVGPGDAFTVAIGGSVPTVLTVPVSADGNLVLPEAGALMAGGRTLAAVQEEATAALQRRFRNVDVQVTLTLPRQFYVHVTGAVPEPGRFLMLPVSRVDDALQQAFAAQVRAQAGPDGTPRIVGSSTAERPALNTAFRPSLRNVVITHRDGSRQSLDLIRYYTTGDTKDNPYLLDGDRVTVPSYHSGRDVIYVVGDVAYPGAFDHREDDTALNLLTLATGVAGPSGRDEIRLTRRLPGGDVQTLLLDLDALRSGQDVPLQPGDRLSVTAEELAEAAIYGLVEHPGTYPIRDGETTLRQLVETAGGLKPDADPSGAYLERRKSLAFKEDGRSSDLDFFSRVFLRSSSDANRVVVSLEEALRPGGPDVVLRDQDRVVFPRDEETVYVIGNVPQPGYVAYVDGQPAHYYIEQAGGQGPLTKGIYVFEEGTGKMSIGDQVVVRSGDTIFVDREDIAESPEIAQLLISDENSRRQARIMTTQTIITSLTAAISIIATLKSFGAFD